MTTNGTVDAKTLLNGGGYYELNLRVDDYEVLAALSERGDEAERHDFAVSALKIGVIALRQAQSNIDVESVRKEGDRLIESMKVGLEIHQREVTEKVSGALIEYFDPRNGRFNERVKDLVDDGGEIERVIRRQIGGDGSELANTLKAHVGVDSAFMKAIDPNAADGLIRQLDETTKSALTEQRKVILDEFSLDNGDGALSRMVSEIKEKHGEVGESLETRIGEVMAEFSLDKKDSALSRMVNQVETAQSRISREFSLDAEDSALARMQKQLLGALYDQQQTNARFQEEVKVALADMTARRREAEKSTRHGLEFEDAVFAFVNERSQKAGDVATATGNATGILRANKKGDVVVKLGADHAAAGAQIVFEAKQDASYTVDNALAEIDEARRNRGAGVGVFVFSKRTVRESLNLEPFSRHGDDIVVVWDSEDPSSDVYLDAGLSVAKAISVQAKSQSDDAGEDFVAIDKAIAEIKRNADSLEEITKSANAIDGHVTKILNRARIVRKGIDRQIGILNEQVDTLR